MRTSRINFWHQREGAAEMTVEDRIIIRDLYNAKAWDRLERVMDEAGLDLGRVLDAMNLDIGAASCSSRTSRSCERGRVVRAVGYGRRKPEEDQE
jgi:hypothetical protein